MIFKVTLTVTLVLASSLEAGWYLKDQNAVLDFSELSFLTVYTFEVGM